MTATPKNFLFINRHAPFGKSLARESLDAALACAVFDQTVTLLFIDDGVFQLLDHQQGQVINIKGVSASLQALSIYDIHNVYVEKQSLIARGIDPQAIGLNAKIIESHQVTELLNQTDVILSF